MLLSSSSVYCLQAKDLYNDNRDVERALDEMVNHHASVSRIQPSVWIPVKISLDDILASLRKHDLGYGAIHERTLDGEEAKTLGRVLRYLGVHGDVEKMTNSLVTGVEPRMRTFSEDNPAGAAADDDNEEVQSDNPTYSNNEVLGLLSSHYMFYS